MPLGLIYPSSSGTVMDANNVGKIWRVASDAIGYDWVTLKTFRKTNATMIAKTMELRPPPIRLVIRRCP